MAQALKDKALSVIHGYTEITPDVSLPNTHTVLPKVVFQADPKEQSLKFESIVSTSTVTDWHRIGYANWHVPRGRSIHVD